jgi:hypothetical protein
MAVTTGPRLNHVQHGKLPCGLGKMLGRCLGSEDRRRGELGGGSPAAAVVTRASAIVRLDLNNKWLGGLLWCTRKCSCACGGEGVDWRGVCTGGTNGGQRWLGASARAREELPRAGLYARGRSVGSRRGHEGSSHTRGEVAAWPATCAAPAANGAPQAVRRLVDPCHLARPTCHGRLGRAPAGAAQ